MLKEYFLLFLILFPQTLLGLESGLLSVKNKKSEVSKYSPLHNNNGIKHKKLYSSKGIILYTLIFIKAIKYILLNKKRMSSER